VDWAICRTIVRLLSNLRKSSFWPIQSDMKPYPYGGTRSPHPSLGAIIFCLPCYPHIRQRELLLPSPWQETPFQHQGTAKSRQYNISYAYSGIVPATAQPLHHTHSDQNEQICTMHYSHVYANALVEVEGVLSQRITLELPGKEGGPSDFGSKKELPDRQPLPMRPLQPFRLRTSTVLEEAKREVGEATIRKCNWS